MMMRPGRASPRAVLLYALLFIAAGVGVFFVSPWLLPVRIVEGPLVQNATADAVTLVWYTSRPVKARDCEVMVGTPSDSRAFPVEADGDRQWTRITGLTADVQQPYRVQFGPQILAQSAIRTSAATDERLAFIVFGDSGLGTPEQYQLAKRMSGPEYAPDFLLHTGDLVYKHGERGHYEARFFAPYRDLVSRVSFWPSLGNHDVLTDNGEPYLGVFDLPRNGPPDVRPETNYWFDCGPARIAVLDSTLPEDVLATKVAPWLKQTLSGTPARWKFVAFHHPPYTCGGHPSNESIQRAIVPTMEACGVDVVFCGHDHIYERTWSLRGGQRVPDGAGITYVVSGSGGGKLYQAPALDKCPGFVAAINNTEHSFTYVQIDGRELSLRQIGIKGRILDEWRLSKPDTSATMPASGAATSPATPQSQVAAPQSQP